MASSTPSGGSWTGTYALRACVQSGVFASVRWCQGLGGVGAILPVALTLSIDREDLVESIYVGYAEVA